MAERFFRASARAGSLQVLDLHEWEPWEPARIQYRNQAEVEWLIRIRGDDPRVIRTVTELDAVITESAEPRLVTLYISEDLLDEARRRWEAVQHRH